MQFFQKNLFLSASLSFTFNSPDLFLNYKLLLFTVNELLLTLNYSNEVVSCSINIFLITLFIGLFVSSASFSFVIYEFRTISLFKTDRPYVI